MGYGKGKIGYSIKRVIVGFKRWDVPLWRKILTVAGLGYLLFLGISAILSTYITFILIAFLFWRILSIPNDERIAILKNALSTDDEKDGYRFGREGYGYYENGIRIHK
ncbi:hypothetical protein ACLRAA_05890 [Gallibacterium anatis]|uniref:hypothetical protein n=1 Tax=Gallibacterium anatis TaxID=750 RepID=UPI000BA0BF68|nr:hypothetical protein [Gallibacterium anatis]WAX71163.1 hypothetical protein CF557_10290 [Gallibacterium anatis]